MAKEISHISELQFDPKNARRRTPRSAGMLQESLQKTGAARSIVIDEQNRILAGNGTVEAAGQVGIEKVKVVDVDGETIVAVRRSGLTEEQKLQLAIYDNRTAELAEWDAGVLAELGEAIDLSEWWFPEEIEGLLQGLEQDEESPVISDEEDEENTADLIEQAEEGAIESRVKLGEIWQLGRHKIACGDSTDDGNVRRLLGDRLGDVGMVWADPPYGMDLDTDFSKMAGKGKKYSKVIGDDKPFDIRRFSYLETEEQFWFGADYYSKTLPDSGGWFVWDKYPTDENSNRFGSGFELAWSKKSHKRDIVRVKSINVNWETVKERCGHPTQKPSALCEWFFDKYGTPNDFIFDPFLGSAPSIIAAQKMEGDRTVYGFELSPDYCEIIIQRWEKFTGQVAKLVGTL